MFQSYALFPHLTARGNVEFGLQAQGAAPISSAACARRWNWCGSTGKESRRPAQLSGGERQRVALARSLVLEPDVLLLDEPLAALDPKLRKQMRVELKEMQRRVGITFLLVTHDQEEALSMSDQLAVMNAGASSRWARPRTLPAPAHALRGRLPGRGELDRRRRRAPGSDAHLARRSRGAAAGRAPGSVTGSVFLGNCVHVLARLDSGEMRWREVPRAMPARSSPAKPCTSAGTQPTS